MTTCPEGPLPVLSHPDVQAQVAEMLTDTALFNELVRRGLLSEEWFVVLRSRSGEQLGRWSMTSADVATTTCLSWGGESGAGYVVEHHLAALAP